MKKMKRGIVFTALFGAALVFGGTQVSAHGYVESPASRAYQGKLEKATHSWDYINAMYGAAADNPQSLEAPKGFPEKGPADGHIASAEGGLGQINDFVLDNQTAERWKKTEIAPGPNTFTWTYTAAHSTAKWHYYITKKGWNPNKPLARSDFELIKEIPYDGSNADTYPTHTVNIPADRSGYNVVLAVWDVLDTGNAFYNVIDVNIKSDGTIVKPDQPKNVVSNNVTKSSLELSWSSDVNAKEYNIYRDGKKITTTPAHQFKDTGLKADTTYRYEIEAVGYSGIVSEKSEPLSVTTKKESDIVIPTTPSGLHTMSITTSTVDLMWKASEHESGIKHYEIYRNGQKIATANNTSYLDTTVTSNTDYTYKVKAISNDGNESAFSNKIKVTTAGEQDDYPEWRLGSFSAPQTYQTGQKVSYKGKNYQALVTHTNYGDTTWAPDVAVTLFKEI